MKTQRARRFASSPIPGARGLLLALAVLLAACGETPSDVTERIPESLGRSSSQEEAPARKPLPPARYGPAERLDPSRVGNPYLNRGLGVSIRKPEAWTWLPETSMEEFASFETRLDVDTMPMLDWGQPVTTPLIGMASKLDPQWGIDPVVYLYVIPSRGELIDIITYQGNPVTVIGGAINLRKLQYQNYAITHAPAPAKVVGEPGATVTIRYDVPGPDGKPLPTEEKRWHVRRGRLFFFIYAITPEGASQELRAEIEAIAESLHIDP